MHKRLKRQLAQANIDLGQPPNTDNWSDFLLSVSNAYEHLDDLRAHFCPSRYKEGIEPVSNKDTEVQTRTSHPQLSNRFDALVNALPDHAFLLNTNAELIEVISQHSLPKHLHKLPTQALLENFFPQDVLAKLDQVITDTLTSDQPQILRYTKKVEGRETIFEARLSPTSLKSDDKQLIILLSRDISELARSQRELEYLATHDPLTNLPNRSRLDRELAATLLKARQEKGALAVMVLDLDRFKQINDSMGHPVGDSVLKKVASRLKPICKDGGMVARFGGDEFVFVFTDLASDEEVEAKAQRILNCFNNPISVGRLELSLSTSIGIALFPQHGEDGNSLIKHADSAMYAAKDAGRSQYSFYRQDMSSLAITGLNLESGLRKAIRNQTLALVYQPQFRLADGSLTGLEALVRWPDAPEDYRSPAVFIPVAESSGLIEPLGLWVFEESCRQINRWQAEGFEYGRIGVNLSSRQLTNPNLPEQIKSRLKLHNLTGESFEFEITESMVVREGGVAHANLEKFSEMGIKLAIDDFGTGHSSLVNLKRFPLARLKIDRSFVDGVGEDPNDEAIAGATIALSKQLGLQVVAEGVETEEQAIFLLNHECEIVQGYLYGRPMTPEQIAEHFAQDDKVIKLPARKPLSA